MKTFRQFFEENLQNPPESPNSRGVLVHNNKIFVGVEHGVTPQLSPEVHNMIQQHMQQHGYHHEGIGGDAEALKPITGNHQYRGSWDYDSVNKHLYTDSNGNRFTPHHHLTSMFSNSAEGTENHISMLSKNPNTSIRDSIKQNSHRLFPDAPLHPDHVDKFFNEAGEKYSSMADKPATAENVRNMLQTGRNDIWDGNEHRNTPIGNLSQRVQDDREKHLLSDKSPPGVYFIGSGHLPSMVKRIPGSKLIGGETAHL
jgi:hypothetical protein